MEFEAPCVELAGTVPGVKPEPIAAYRLRPGQRLNGKYEVLNLIGSGGFGFVIAARHIGFDANVALKFLYPEFAAVGECMERFAYEARTNFRIRSPHVVRVLDVDALPDGTLFIAMELLQGIDLRRLLKRFGRLPIEHVVDYTLQTCAGLKVAHGLGIVHRDIKPENLFLTTAANGVIPHIKVLDFGTSKATWTGVHRPGGTQANGVHGTPQYMSPEHIRGAADLDARSDIWTLGCLIYELLSGVAPFERSTAIETCAAVLGEQPVSLAERCPHAPAALVEIVARCLEKAPALRPQHVSELERALAPLVSAGPASVAQPRHVLARLKLVAATTLETVHTRAQDFTAQQLVAVVAPSVRSAAKVSVAIQRRAQSFRDRLSWGAALSWRTAVGLLLASLISSLLVWQWTERRPRRSVQPRLVESTAMRPAVFPIAPTASSIAQLESAHSELNDVLPNALRLSEPTEEHGFGPPPDRVRTKRPNLPARRDGSIPPRTKNDEFDVGF